MVRKAEEKKLHEVMYLRLDGNTRQRLNGRAKLENATASEVVRNAIAEYLDKDISWQGQMEGRFQSLMNEVQVLKKEVRLFSSLWIHWTEFYFTYTKSMAELNDAQRQQLVQEGKRRSQLMIESFKKQIKDKKPGLVESLIAEYLVT